MSRTPRREAAAAGTPTTVVAAAAAGGHARERALQDPGLKDYVCFVVAAAAAGSRGRPACVRKGVFGPRTKLSHGSPELY